MMFLSPCVYVYVHLLFSWTFLDALMVVFVVGLLVFFCVNSAYNLGNIIRYEPTSRGLFYFVGLFSPIMFVWTSKMSYQ